MKKKSILSVVLSIAILFSFFSMSLPAAVTAEDEPTALEALEALVEQWEDVPIGDYTTESYDALQEALDDARDVVVAGIPDGATGADALFGPFDDANWRVSMPDGSFASLSEQAYMEFSEYEEDGVIGVRGTYLAAAIGQYNPWGLWPNGFGNIYFKYDRSSNPVAVDFSKDTLSIDIKSGIYSGGSMTEPRPFLIYLVCKDQNGNSRTISATYLHAENNNSIIDPTDGVNYKVTINLSDFLENESSYGVNNQHHVDEFLAPNNNQIYIESVSFSQDPWEDGTAGISYIIKDLTITHNRTDVADAMAELQAAIAGLEIVDPLKRLQALVEQWEDEPGDDYTAESYAALQAALANARDVIAAGVPDSSTVVPLVGGYDDPKWEVSNPSGGYVGQFQQGDVFGGVNHIDFLSYGESSMRATYKQEAKEAYGGVFGNINFRYNHSEDLPVIDFKHDKLNVKIRSGILPELTTPINFKISMQFKDVYMPWGQADINIPWMATNGYVIPGTEELNSPTDGVTFEATIDLAWVLEQEWEQDYLDGLFAGLDYKPELEYIWFRQDVQYAGDAGISFIIDELTLTKYYTPVADAVAELEAAIAGLEIDYLKALQALVEQWEDEPGDDYTAESYAAFQAALAQANAAIASGKPDSIETVSIVGGPDDPNWEVKNPNIMEPGYTPKDQQIATFGANHMEFVPWGAQLVRCTYAAGQGKYGVDGQFGAIDFRYNRSANPLELNFKNDTINLRVKSGFAPDYPEHAVKAFTIVLSFTEDIPDITIPWLISENSGYITPNSESIYETTIKLANVLIRSYAQDYVDTYLKPLDYKVHLEYILIDQTIDYNGDVGLSFVINEFSLTDVEVGVTIAYNELQAAINALVSPLEGFTEAISLLSEKDLNFLDRHEIFEVKKLYDELSANQKKKVPSGYKKLLDKCVKMVADVEKTGYLFPIFDSVKGWVTNNATNPESEATLQNTYGPLTEKTAYLGISGGNGSLVVSATGKSMEHKAYWGGAIIGWPYVNHYFTTPALIDLENSGIYYDIDSEVRFMIRIHFSEGANGISFPVDRLNELGEALPGSYKGVLNLKELISSLSDSQKKAMAIKNKKKALISSIHILYVSDNADTSRKINIRTLAIADTKYEIKKMNNPLSSSPKTGEDADAYRPVIVFMAVLPICVAWTYFSRKIKRGKNRKGVE